MPEAVSYYQRTFGVSAEVAKERLATQLMGQGVETTLDARYGDAIAGVSFDNATGRWMVDATPAVPASGIDAVFARTGLSGTYRMSRVAYTGSDVTRASADVAGRLHTLVSKGLVAVTAGGGQVSVAVSTNASPTDRTAVAAVERSAATSFAAPVAQSMVAGTLAAQATKAKCRDGYCNTLLAGDAYTSVDPINGNVFTCTMSWYGSTTFQGVTKDIMLTAGHCALEVPEPTVLTYDLADTVVFGTQHVGRYDAGGDWGYIYTDNPPPPGLDPELGRPYGGYIDWKHKKIHPLLDYYPTGAPSNGTVVCHSGAGSFKYLGEGTQCGTAGGLTTILEDDDGIILTIGNMLQINSTQECFGDSGGPWDLSSPATAVAIESAVSIVGQADCGQTAWATPVSTPIQDYAGFDLVLNSA